MVTCRGGTGVAGEEEEGEVRGPGTRPGPSSWEPWGETGGRRWRTSQHLREHPAHQYLHHLPSSLANEPGGERKNKGAVIIEIMNNVLE